MLLLFSQPFYLPMALAIPPTHALVHIQFNLLFQFWIHTECVGTLGPLEHVLNTPQHHRVHHGIESGVDLLTLPNAHIVM